MHFVKPFFDLAFSPSPFILMSHHDSAAADLLVSKLREDVFTGKLVDGGLRCRGDDDDALLPWTVIVQGLENGKAAARPHHEIEHHRVVSLDSDSSQRFVAARCLLDLELLPLQHDPNETAYRRIIIDDQDGWLRHNVRSMRPNGDE